MERAFSVETERKKSKRSAFLLAFRLKAWYNIFIIPFFPEFPLKILRYLFLFLILLSLAATLSSCAIPDVFRNAGDELRLFRAEWHDISEFFSLSPADSTESYTTETAVPDPPQDRLLDAREHIEIIESLYNGTSRYSSLVSLDDPILFISADSVPADKNGYTAIPRFADPNVSSVSAILAAHGIEVQQVSAKNPAPSGDVFALRYAGTSDENGYYVNPDVPVTLYVSAQKKAVFQPDPQAASVVYLTFDDGPTATDTIRLLDILDTYGVKATFFTMGEAVGKYPDSAHAIVERGHAFGCHSFTHVYDDIYASTDAMKTEVEQWEKAVEDAGISLSETKLFRFPGGSASSYLTDESRADMKEMLEERGYLIFDWNVVTNDAVLYLRDYGVTPLDYIRATFEETFARCVNETAGREGVPIIILMHETVTETIELMPWMLETLIAQGYTFGSLGNFSESWMFHEGS